MYHPVTTELEKLGNNVKELVDAIIESELKYVVIYPNNDPGSNIIFNEYERFNNMPNFKLFPSIQFEKFLVLLKNCKFIIGNSSTGIREAPIYSVPTINLGSRQKNRFHHESIFNIDENKDLILNSINQVIKNSFKFSPSYFFGKGESAAKFKNVLEKKIFWKTKTQKQFLDL
jgi:UDP-N-acetylglucosamine 2-epimerase (hydrolysing)